MSKAKPTQDPLIGRRVLISPTATGDEGEPHPWRDSAAQVMALLEPGLYDLALVDLNGKTSKTRAALTMQQFTVVDQAGERVTTGADPQLLRESPWAVAFSLTNPRKHHGLDIDSINGLAASIKAQGLAQPILVRPLPGSRAADTFRDREPGHPLPTYELVCGERRLRASRAAGLDTIPMILRELSDDQALELQLVENIEREDLDPMEEAEGYELLRDKLGYSVEQIAERIAKGKGESYIYKTMKLLELTPESREALHDGTLGRSTGLLVARYPADQQAEVVDFIKNHARDGTPAPFRAVAPLVYQRFNLDLSGAPWDLNSVTLLPAAGSCGNCPKRTGLDGDLFGDPKTDDGRCTDAQCFADKRAAHIELQVVQAKKQGLEVISGDQAREIFPNNYRHQYARGYADITGVAYSERVDDGTEREVTFADALRKLGKKAPKPVVVIHPHTGAAVQMIPDELADRLQAEQEPRDTQTQAIWPQRGHEPPDTRPPEQQAMDDRDVKRAVITRIFDTVRTSTRTQADMLLIARAFFSALDEEPPYLADYLSWADDLADKSEEEARIVIDEKLAALPANDLAAVVTMLAVEQLMTGLATWALEQVRVPQAYGVDILAVRDKVAEDLARAQQQDAASDGEQQDEEQEAEA